MEETLNFTCGLLFSKEGLKKSYHISVTYIYVSKVIGAVNLAAIVPTVVINLSIAVTLMRVKSLQTLQNLILLLTVFVNLGQGLISMPSHGVLIVLRSMRSFSCTADALVCYFGASLSMISMLTIDLLAYDRYDAIRDPFKHEINFTKTKLTRACIAIVTVSLINSSMFFMKTLKYVAISLATVVTIGTYVFNVIVHILIMKTVKKLRLRQAANSLDGTEEQKRDRQRKEKRTTKFTLYVVGFLLLCYAPNVFKNFINMLSIENYIAMVADTILLLHALFSPILYLWQAPQIGRAVSREWRSIVAIWTSRVRVQPATTG